MKFSRASLRGELEELRIQKSKLAFTVNIRNEYLSQYLAGTRQPTDDVVRKIFTVFAIVRAEQMKTGGFALNAKNIKMLQKKLAQMEKSIGRSKRPQPADAPTTNVEEERACVN